MRPLGRGVDQLGRGGALSKQVCAWEMYAEARVAAASSFTASYSPPSRRQGKRLRAPVRLRWAALWLFTEAVDVWGRDMNRLGQGGALSKRMVA